MGASSFDYNDWKRATVEWLCQPQMFTPAKLPKMQVPGSKSHGVYESREQYVDTVERLMVGMTFSDGHAALSPHCYEKDPQGKPCGCVLWPVDPKRGSVNTANPLTCRTRGCSAQVVWVCQNGRHSPGLCMSCSKKERGLLMGQAGPHASGHVYDGYVSRIDVGGKLYIEGFESRCPPKESDGKVRTIHWRSTKRLACPNLVGVVRLGGGSLSNRSKGRALNATDPILWGELCPQGPPKEESTQRQNGRLCLNMTSITGGFNVEFAEGDMVVVIDCMTFVPEYIPVLRALEQQKLHTLPFDDGALLNLWQHRPPDLSNTIGQRQEHRIEILPHPFTTHPTPSHPIHIIPSHSSHPSHPIAPPPILSYPIRSHRLPPHASHPTPPRSNLSYPIPSLPTPRISPHPIPFHPILMLSPPHPILFHHI